MQVRPTAAGRLAAPSAGRAARQRTLAGTVEVEGVTLHGGHRASVRLQPAPAGSGLVLRRVAADGRRLSERPLRAAAVSGVDLATTVEMRGDDGEAFQVRTVEHLLAALAGLGVDACLVEVEGDEIPILDGSAAPWVERILRAGLRTLASPRRVVRLLRPFAVEVGDASMAAYPADALRVTCAIDFEHAAIGSQEISLAVTPESFAAELAPARTFGFLRDVETLREAGLARGGSMENAIVLDESGVVNGSLRFADEFVRHKAMDLVGDLALLGAPFVGHVVARRAGHRVHVEFVRRLLQATDAWRLETAGASPAQARARAAATPAAVPAAVSILC